jgi:uncharacterized protein (AIM24 family)
MRYQISGTTMQTVAVDLAPGETLYSQTNCMAWMSDTIQMNTHTGGGLFAGIKRSLTGGSLFITDFTATAAAHISFAPRFPGTIVARKLAAHESLICRKETFLCAEKSVALEIAWQQRIGAGFFLAARDLYCSGSRVRAWFGSICPVNSWSGIWPRARGCWFMPVMWACRSPRCNSPYK